MFCRLEFLHSWELFGHRHACSTHVNLCHQQESKVIAAVGCWCSHLKSRSCCNFKTEDYDCYNCSSTVLQCESLFFILSDEHFCKTSTLLEHCWKLCCSTLCVFANVVKVRQLNPLGLGKMVNLMLWDGHQWSSDSYKKMLLAVAAPIVSQPQWNLTGMNEQLTGLTSFSNQLPGFSFSRLYFSHRYWDYDTSDMTKSMWWVFKESCQCQVSWVWLFICASVCVSWLFCCVIHMAAYRPPWTSSSSCLNRMGK